MILDNMGRLLQLILNKLHTKKELIDRLFGRLFHIDKNPKFDTRERGQQWYNDDLEDPKHP
jgi:hypothetical protein